MIRAFKTPLIMIFAFWVCAGAACQSTPVSSCGGFSLNNLSPEGTVALIKANRPGFERVTANDNNYRRQCLEK